MKNKKTGRKILFALIVTVISAAVLLPGAAAVIYWLGVRTNAPVQDLTGIVMTPSGDSRLGDTVTASVLLKMRGTAVRSKPPPKSVKARPCCPIRQSSVSNGASVIPYGI